MGGRATADRLADALRQAVRGSGLSLNELERRCGVSHAVLSRFQRGERTLTLPLASRVCAVLGLVLVQREGFVLEPPGPGERRPGRPRKTRAAEPEKPKPRRARSKTQ